LTIKKHLDIARTLAKLLDSRFEFFGIKFGFDSILELIPGVGDIIAVIVSLYIVLVAYRIQLPLSRLFKMCLNIIFDFAIGIFPVVGPIGTIFFRSNQMNIKIIDQFLKTDIIEEGEIVG